MGKTLELLVGATAIAPMIEEVDGIVWEIVVLGKEDMGGVQVVTFRVANMTSKVTLDGSVEPGATLWFEWEDNMNILDVMDAMGAAINEELRRRRNC